MIPHTNIMIVIPTLWSINLF